MKQGSSFSSQEGLCLKEMETQEESKDSNRESAAREIPCAQPTKSQPSLTFIQHEYFTKDFQMGQKLVEWN